MMPAYLMEQLARQRGEELTRQAERAQILSEQGDSIYRRSSRLRLWRLRFNLRKTDPPVESTFPIQVPSGRPAQDWCSLLHANRANR
jgi:hypothetical protein